MKLTKKLTTMVVLVALSSSVTVKSEPAEIDVKEAIHNLETALNENNIEDLKNIYSDKAMVIPAEAKILNDNNAIASFWDKQLKDGKYRYNIDVIDFQVNNNIAYLSAMWSATVTRNGNNTEILDGYMSTILERQSDGNWKIRIQNWN